MGELFRRFWLPVLLSREVPKPDGPPVRLRILSENLIAFRDINGQVGLLGRYCPHRGASLFFGRNDAGTRIACTQSPLSYTVKFRSTSWLVLPYRMVWARSTRV
jgi:phenylpropionate dioxygenase-like ring-hydroxylating dioxygenase large terminal subunit